MEHPIIVVEMKYRSLSSVYVAGLAESPQTD
jgi:hypothetical protein